MQSVGLTSIVPVADEGDVVVLEQGNKYFPVVVRYRTRLPESRQLQQDFGAIAANANTAKTAMTNLQLDNNQFAQLRSYPVHPIEYELYVPGTTAHWQIRNIVGRISRQVRAHDPALETTEFFWVGYNVTPNLVAYNTGAYALSASVIQFFGFRYDFEPLPMSQFDLKADSTWSRQIVAKQGGDPLQNVIWLTAEARQAI